MAAAIAWPHSPTRVDERSDEYLRFSAHLATTHASRSEALAELMSRIAALAREVAPRAELHGRLKSLRSTWSKMRRKHVDLDQVLDALGVRVIVPTTRDCYRLLERVGSTFEVIAGECDDYIASPKPNGYRGLHQAIIGPRGHPAELQLRATWMHAIAEKGAAAHWRYKKLREPSERRRPSEGPAGAVGVSATSNEGAPRSD